MAASGTTGSGFRARAGTLTLLYVSGSLEREELLQLLEGALSGGMLDGDDELAGVCELSGLEGVGEGEFEEEYDDELEDLGGRELDETWPTDKGEQFIFVTAALEHWLSSRPAGPLQLGPEAGQAIAPLACSWSAAIAHALTAEPMTLPELDRTVGDLGYETVAEHVEAMESAGQVEARAAGGETRYAPTEWLRQAIAPIVAAARYECHYPEEDVAPPDILDVEAAFQLALPLLVLPPDLRGCCRLGVRIPEGESLVAGATVEVDRGRVIAASPLLERAPETWVTGSPLDWMDTVVEPSVGLLEMGGDARLAGALIDSLHSTLFGAMTR